MDGSEDGVAEPVGVGVGDAVADGVGVASGVGVGSTYGVGVDSSGVGVGSSSWQIAVKGKIPIRKTTIMDIANSCLFFIFSTPYLSSKH